MDLPQQCRQYNPPHPFQRCRNPERIQHNDCPEPAEARAFLLHFIHSFLKSTL
jgi:hypothetical protein